VQQEVGGLHLRLAGHLDPDRADQDDADDAWGPQQRDLGGFRGLDGPASAQIRRDLLGWQPARPGLIAGLKQGPLLRLSARKPLSARPPATLRTITAGPRRDYLTPFVMRQAG
jgi:hypothetical protein